ncbi:MAG: serine/threonine protein kinase [Polyangiaceae bacterium]|nr:serine/threonine protein kinase [Polyangiaceae bacterium]
MSQAHPQSPVQRAAQRVGKTLLKWRLDALLGVGGTAAVYAATHHNRSRVALKILHRELAVIPELRTRFLREAYVANSVEHEGAVGVIDDQLSEEGEPVLIMQLLDGQSLDVLQAKRGILPVDEALHYADQILSVLAAAHARGVVHRDIKPQNVFITHAGVVKVLDFGVARLFDGSASMTATGVLVGTPAFMPPEQAGGRTADIGPRSDLWAVGATVFNLLTGRFVHEAENVQQHTVRAAVIPARSLGTLRPDLPKPLVGWVDKALAFQVENRFASALEMQVALAHVRAAIAPVKRESLPNIPPTFSTPDIPPPRASAPPQPPAPPAAPAPPAFDAPLVFGARPFAAPAAPAPQPHPSPGVPPFDGAPPAGPPTKDAAAIARAHGLPPPEPKTPITQAQKLGILLVFVTFVAIVSLIVYKASSKKPTDGEASGGKPAPSLGMLVGTGTSSVSPSPTATAPAPSGDPASPNGLKPEAGLAALDAGEAEALKCAKKLGPKGRVSVDVTFHPDGDTTAQVEIRFSRTPVGICIEDAFRTKAKVQPFEGSPVMITRMIHLQ